jgi:hypothetical protein
MALNYTYQGCVAHFVIEIIYFVRVAWQETRILFVILVINRRKHIIMHGNEVRYRKKL